MILQTTDAAELLPHQAAELLRAKRRERDDAGAVLRNVATQAMDLRLTRQEAEARLRSLTQTVRPLPADHPSVVQARRSIDSAAAEMTRLANHEATVSGTFNHAGRLVTAIERWVQGHAAEGRGFAVAPTIEPRLLAGENVVDGITRVRQEVRRLEADLHACRSAPIPAAEAKAAAREQVAALAARGRPFVEAAIEHGEPISFEGQHMRVASVPVEGVPQVMVAWQQLDALGLFAWVHQDALTKKLCAEIDAAADDEAAISTADRKKREAELLGDIAMTQKQVSALIRLAETEGIAVEFDADTPVEIVLGVVAVDAGPRPANVEHADEALRVTRAMEAAKPVAATPPAS